MIRSLVFNQEAEDSLEYIGGTVDNEATGSGAGGFTMDFHASAQIGDLAIVVASSDIDGGWSASGWTTLVTNVSGSPCYEILYKTIDSLSTVSFSPRSIFGYPEGNSAVMAVFRNGTMDTTYDTTTGSGSMPNPSALTVATAGDIVIAVGMMDDLNTSSVTAQSGYTLVASRGNSSSGGTYSSSTVVSYKISTATGSEDPAIFPGSDTPVWTAATMIVEQQ